MVEGGLIGLTSALSARNGERHAGGAKEDTAGEEQKEVPPT